ncbi:MAG TPA: carboxypeptidase-like regulatory domain-containing protein [Candidatus Acidoferrales bacterium]|nr:carboxypeptidase-like regulatory domain-containing protein [Candidatus Acidoferrales bacterium]
MKPATLLVVAALLSSGPAMAMCHVPQPRLVSAEYFASKVVVQATLTKVEPVLEQKDDPLSVLAYVYTLRANRLLRGNIGGVFHVYEGNDSGRASFRWKVGRQYLLFLFYAKNVQAWALDGCGNSGPMTRAQPALDQIQAIQTSSDGGVIRGIVTQSNLGTPVSGVHLEARGTGGIFTGVSDHVGNFEIKVPAGRYTLHARKKGLKFRTHELSYEKANDLTIQPGGCVQVQLVPPSP